MWRKKMKNGLIIDSTNLLPVEEPEVRKYASTNEIYYLGLELEMKIALKKKYISNFDTNKSSLTYNVLLHDQILYRYEILKFLGTGSYGIVVQALDHKLNKEVAIKICKRGESRKVVLQHEAQILTDLKNKFREGNFVKILDFFIFRDTPFMVTELLQNDLCTLFLSSPLQGGISMIKVKEIILSTLKGLSQLKESNIIHGDLKPSNIVMCKEEVNEVKIIDFGGSRYANDSTPIKHFTRHYRAPEIILELEQNFPADIWALGCIAFELYTGKTLFEGADRNDQLAAIMEVLGSPPSKMRKSSLVKNDYFRPNGRPIYCTRPNGSIIHPNLRVRQLPGTKPLRTLLKDCPYPLFIEFLQKCITWDPSVRITPSEAMNHTLFENSSVQTEPHSSKSSANTSQN